MQGSVYVCPDCFDETDKETIEVKGFQLGERFGHSICFVDINGDGFDDLVVGAPLHSKKTDVSNIISYLKINMQKNYDYILSCL